MPSSRSVPLLLTSLVFAAALVGRTVLYLSLEMIPEPSQQAPAYRMYQVHQFELALAMIERQAGTLVISVVALSLGQSSARRNIQHRLRHHPEYLHWCIDATLRPLAQRLLWRPMWCGISSDVSTLAWRLLRRIPRSLLRAGLASIR